MFYATLLTGVVICLFSPQTSSCSSVVSDAAGAGELLEAVAQLSSAMLHAVRRAQRFADVRWVTQFILLRIVS